MKTPDDYQAQPGTRLNKYIAHTGLCSRRKADELIKKGEFEVDGETIWEVGFRVQEGQVVTHKGEELSIGKHYYVLFNKPKNCITTTSDERGRKTVMDLVRPGFERATNNANIRIYPVGRLDRPTTGLLLLTNDGDLAKKLTHPSHNIKKLYRVELDKELEERHFNQILKGLTLEDGAIQADELAYPDAEDHRIVGIELHSGKNRIVRRIFAHLGYNVEKLDRVMFAGLTKKDLPRGRWRFLEDREVIMLKHFTKT